MKELASSKDLVANFREEIKKRDKILYWDLEALLFAIAYASDRQDFDKATRYVLGRF